MIIGQGPWVEDSIKQIDPEIRIGFAGYPVSEDPTESQVITGADQALRISKNSPVLQEVTFYRFCQEWAGGGDLE